MYHQPVEMMYMELQRSFIAARERYIRRYLEELVLDLRARSEMRGLQARMHEYNDRHGRRLEIPQIPKESMMRRP